MTEEQRRLPPDADDDLAGGGPEGAGRVDVRPDAEAHERRSLLDAALGRLRRRPSPAGEDAELTPDDTGSAAPWAERRERGLPPDSAKPELSMSEAEESPRLPGTGVPPADVAPPAGRSDAPREGALPPSPTVSHAAAEDGSRGALPAPSEPLPLPPPASEPRAPTEPPPAPAGAEPPRSAALRSAAVEGEAAPAEAAPGEAAPSEAVSEEPLEEAAALATTALEADAEPRPLRRATGISAHLVVLGALATAVVLGFLLAEPSPRWLLLLGGGAVVMGLDGTLRQTWRQPFEAGAETAPYLFVPALYMLGVPVLIEHNIRGELVLVIGLAAGAGFGVLAWAELASVRPHAEEYPRARLIVTGATYLAGFAIFSLTYVFEVGLVPAIAAVALAATMLSVELLREGEVDPLETLGLSLVTGLVLAETRWLLYYIPLDRYLAGLTLLLAFYLVTGLLHSHITRAFNAPLAVEYTSIAAAGLALVVAARAAGLA